MYNFALLVDTSQGLRLIFSDLFNRKLSVNIFFLNAIRFLQGVVILNFTFVLICLIFFQLTTNHQLARKQSHSCGHVHIHTHSLFLQSWQKCDDEQVLKCSPPGFPLCILIMHYTLATLFFCAWALVLHRNEISSFIQAVVTVDVLNLTASYILWWGNQISQLKYFVIHEPLIAMAVFHVTFRFSVQ